MKLKELVEKKNELKQEYRSLIELASTEKRNLNATEEVREAELAAEIADLNIKIQEAEKRAVDEADVVEDIKSEKEKREMENKITKEVEIRAVEQFIRKQDGEELRQVTAGAAPGSLTVPTNLSNYIVEKLYEVAPLFSRTKNFTPVNGTLEILRETAIGETGVGFVGEMTDLAKGDFTMDKVTLRQKRAGTAIELSQHLVNDSGIDIVNYAVNILSRRLGLTLDRNILNGTGDANNQFEGILTSVSINDVAASTVDGIAIDDLLAVYNSMDPTLVGGAVWVVNRPVFNLIAKLKDNNGHYYLVNEVTANGPVYKLFGQPILINDAMLNAAANQRSVLLGNFSEGYATMTKQGLNLQHISGDTTQALRGSHLLLLDGYMDGKVLNTDAFKFLKQPAV